MCHLFHWILANMSNVTSQPFSLSGVAKNVVLPALGAIAGTLTTNAVDGESLDFKEAAQGAIFNILFQNLPKYLGHKLNKSKSIYIMCIT